MRKRPPPTPSDRGNSPTPAPPTRSGTSAAHSGSSSAACPVADDAVHLLSELCANAIVHSDSGKTGGTFTVRAQHVVNSYVWGEVEDQGSDWDGDLSGSARHPHGLYLLERWPPPAASSGSGAFTSSGSASTTRRTGPSLTSALVAGKAAATAA